MIQVKGNSWRGLYKDDLHHTEYWILPRQRSWAGWDHPSYTARCLHAVCVGDCRSGAAGTVLAEMKVSITWIKQISSKNQILDQMKRAKMCGKLSMICITCWNVFNIHNYITNAERQTFAKQPRPLHSLMEM